MTFLLQVIPFRTEFGRDFEHFLIGLFCIGRAFVVFNCTSTLDIVTRIAGVEEDSLGRGLQHHVLSAITAPEA